MFLFRDDCAINEALKVDLKSHLLFLNLSDVISITRWRQLPSSELHGNRRQRRSSSAATSQQPIKRRRMTDVDQSEGSSNEILPMATTDYFENNFVGGGYNEEEVVN